MQAFSVGDLRLSWKYMDRIVIKVVRAHGDNVRLDALF
ncbi:hypothetical protein DSOL_2926 [Desulfosporosinus metallidurans]|uniref:Uncharacterized protein n=1 Tax=Desulfosporosinus metallidurans TaxID=1888891 RepID=A0A1Q8QU91_9FIRM|nr:hypothetical protein DSOL_2926 [Desulfosporosinus metallidurans]